MDILFGKYTILKKIFCIPVTGVSIDVTSQRIQYVKIQKMCV